MTLNEKYQQVNNTVRLVWKTYGKTSFVKSLGFVLKEKKIPIFLSESSGKNPANLISYIGTGFCMLFL